MNWELQGQDMFVCTCEWVMGGSVIVLLETKMWYKASIFKLKLRINSIYSSLNSKAK